ncbi:hypothetical protein LTR08_006958 [Meristemomyces frigidus]|nr:hypothetical protein LTR08_006958 [Meristemomyces frigidus]
MPSTDMEKQPLLEQPQTVSVSDTEAQQPSLAELQQNVFQAQREYMKAWSRTTSGKLHKRIMYTVTAIILLFLGSCIAVIALDGLSDDYPPTFTGRVPLEAHIMSKCPDARDCLHDMILPAMQNISHKVDFKLSYIGKYVPSFLANRANANGNSMTDHDDGVTCLHGQEECLGNIIELCAARIYPDPKMYLGFTMCLSKQYEDIPKRSLIEDCALEHGMSMAKLNDCTVDQDGALSVDMLKQSFNRSALAGVRKSCTIRLNGKTRCVRDGGEWSNCDGGATAQDLVNDVLEESRRIWKEYAG